MLKSSRIFREKEKTLALEMKHGQNMGKNLPIDVK
jgi:hypothetical protein